MGFLTARRGVARVAFGLVVMAAPRPAIAQRGLEYEVKAAYLYNLIHFIEWPNETLGAPADAFRVCVVGVDPFGGALERTFRAERIQNHPVQIVHGIAELETGRCHVLFVPAAEPNARAHIRRAAAGLGQLVVGESPAFIADGGAINFVVVAGRIRFDVNRAALDAQRLKASSKLLHLARNIDRGSL